MKKCDCDIIIVGSGAAGLFCALNLPKQLNVQIVTKESAEQCNSYLAQGGICVMRGEDDFTPFLQDTMHAGHYQNNAEAVSLMIRQSNQVIRDLISYGVSFSASPSGELCYTKEGGHSISRILHHKDITGKNITEELLRCVKQRENTHIREHVSMIDLIHTDAQCEGIVVINEEEQPECIRAPIVVLCTGGIGGLFQNTTNFPHITGDAVAIAIKHGVKTQNLDYIQVHPTALYSQFPGRHFLVSESVRGEGALLYNKNGTRFTDELLPRDKLTDHILRQMKADNSPHVWLDMRPIGKDAILSHFPTIYQRCLDQGIDALTDFVPVVPAQHYFMGGIQVNLAGQTSMPGLYACGETCCNGVHGKNRLASNSMLESLVFAQRIAEDVTFRKPLPLPGYETIVNLSDYSNPQEIFAQYGTLLLEEIERTKKSHEQNYHAVACR